MKPGACLINTARGPVVDGEALRKALLSGRLSATLDVLAEELFRKNHPLLGMDQVVLTPHCAWYSEISMGKLLVSAAEEVVRTLRHPVKTM